MTGCAGVLAFVSSLMKVSNGSVAALSVVGPGCVKTQKRPPVIVFKLTNISDEPCCHCKKIVDFKLTQMRITQHLIPTLAAKTFAEFSHSLGQ